MPRPVVVTAPKPAAARPPRPVAARPPKATVKTASWRAPAAPQHKTLLASAEIEQRRRRMRSWYQSSSARQAALSPQPVERPKLVSARFRPSTLPPLVRRPELVVQVNARPYGSKTFVYYNAGSQIGMTPLAIQFDRPGRHRLDFFTPSTGSRITRWVTVGGKAPQRLTVRTGPPRELAGLR
jgi:hypothetical protein